MRNKKLISMLMLSAGFAACTQDELVDTPNVNHEAQGDLVEDVTFGVSLNENAVTRADYAGAWDSEDEETRTYKIFEHFYLEPEISEGKIVLSDNTDLRGDMIGLCLTSGASAITNYPFYIAGYHSAAQTEFDDEDAQEAYKNKVYGFSENNSNKLYKLELDAKQEYALATVDAINTSIEAKGGTVLNADLDVDALDVTKGIVRTNSAIMTGKYIAYYPFNEGFTEPAGIPLKGEYAMKDLFELTSLPTTRAAAVEAVDFSKYLMAVSQSTIDVKGGTRGGDINLTPKTSALTFILTNSDTEKASEEIKRVTIRSANDEEAFILDGTVALDNLSGINATKATDLIGISFPKQTIAKAVAADEETGTKANQTERYLTIPFFANPSVTGYVIEVYNTKGQIAVIEKTNATFGIGEAPYTIIDLAKCDFEDATRKIFDEGDFEEEVIAGGSLELMKDVDASKLTFSVPAKNGEEEVPALNIIGNGHSLTLGNANEINVDINMTNGNLNVYGGTINGNINGNYVLLGAVVKGNVTADQIDVNSPSLALDFSNVKLTADVLHFHWNQDAVTHTVKQADVKELKIDNGGKVEFDRYYNAETYQYSTPKVGKVDNKGNLAVKYMEAGDITNYGNLSVMTNLKANSLTDSGFNWSGNKYWYGKTEINGYVNSELVYTSETWANSLTWDSGYAVACTVNIKFGTLNVKNSSMLSGNVTNENGTLNLTGLKAFNGTLTNKGTLNIKNNISFQGGTMTLNGTTEVGQGVTLSGKSPVIALGENAKLIKVVGAADADGFVKAMTGGTAFEKLYTEVRLETTVSVEDAFETNKLLTLGSAANLTVAENTKLAGVKVKEHATATLTAPTNVSVEYITIGFRATLNLGKDSYINVSGVVTNSGTYNGVGSIVNCSDFTGNGVWTDNVTPNC